MVQELVVVEGQVPVVLGVLLVFASKSYSFAVVEGAQFVFVLEALVVLGVLLVFAFEPYPFAVVEGA